MGTPVSESVGRQGIRFRPFAPPRRIIGVALVPAFRGADVPANRGIAFEFAGADERRYALAEWPANGGSVDRFPLLLDGDPSCPQARSFPRSTEPSGIVWSTPHGLIMTLQADGANDARTLRREWRKLIRRGACGPRF